MEYFPLFAKLTDKRCLVVGGGTVAARKVSILMQYHAQIVLISPRLCEKLHHYPEGSFTHCCKVFSPSDIEGSILVIAASDDVELNREIAALCQRAGILVNVADSPGHGDVIFPSIIRRPPLQIALSSGGASPILARLLRWRLEVLIPQVYGNLAILARDYRERVKQCIATPKMRRRFWEKVLQGPIAEMIFSGRDGEARESFQNLLAGERGEPTTGEVYLVGAGPG